MQNLRSHTRRPNEKCALSIQIPYSSGHTEKPNNNRQIQCSEEKRHALRVITLRFPTSRTWRRDQNRPAGCRTPRLECRAGLLIKNHLSSQRSPQHFHISSCLWRCRRTWCTGSQRRWRWYSLYRQQLVTHRRGPRGIQTSRHGVQRALPQREGRCHK